MTVFIRTLNNIDMFFSTVDGCQAYVVKVVVSDVVTNYGREIDCASYPVALFMCQPRKSPRDGNGLQLLYSRVQKFFHKSNRQLYYINLVFVVPNIRKSVSLHSILLAPFHVVF